MSPSPVTVLFENTHLSNVAFADVPDADTASAAQWCVEQGLLTAEGGTFRPKQRVAKHRVIKVWKQAAAPQK